MKLSSPLFVLQIIILLFLAPLTTQAGVQSFENNRILVAVSTQQEFNNDQYPLETTLLTFINNAQTNLDIAVQELRWGSVVLVASFGIGRLVNLRL